MFGFPEVPRKVYKSNFLRHISITLNYKKISDGISLDYESFAPILSDFFPDFNIGEKRDIGVSFNQQKGIIEREVESHFSNVLIFKNDKTNSSIKISDTDIEIDIEGRLYSSFTDIRRVLEGIFDKCCKTLSINEFLNISIKKLNVLEIDKEGRGKEGFEDFVYSAYNNFMNNDLSIPTKRFVINDFRSINMHNENSLLNLKYGINSPENVPGDIKHIFIDARILQNMVNVQDALNSIDKINQELFNIYNWTISEKLINLINE